jgi:hypothetical protein
VSQKFVVHFSSDTASAHYMNQFAIWLHDRLQEELFVDHFRNQNILMWFDRVQEVESGQISA